MIDPIHYLRQILDSMIIITIGNEKGPAYAEPFREEEKKED
jgi:hypothetical protein